MTWWQSKERKTVAPYTALAPIYDFVMNHVDYPAWAEYIVRLIRRHNVPVHSLLDISCGTGNFCSSVASRGMPVFGCDGSWEMVHQAVRKAARDHLLALFWCADMTAIASGRSYGCIVSLYDSMNYLLQEWQWRCCFDRVYEVLEPGGLFVFDISTLSNSREFFRRFVQREQNHQARYRRKSYFSEDVKIQNNEFDIQFRNKLDVVYHEHHRQRIRSLDEVEQLIQHTPFQLLSCYEGFTFRQGSDESERVHIVLQK
ncbi:class I SAM-dependent methyltransferase [candidate division KSB1 bacterium]|nr:class I SAM-dependent methyltransferase [candidate division KSB1 bacterium]